MNRTKSLFGALVVGAVVTWASSATAGSPREPANPLRVSAAVSRPRAPLPAPQPTIAASEAAAEPTAAPVREASAASGSVRSVAHSIPVLQPTPVSNTTPYELGGEYIIEGSGEVMDGDVVFDGFAGGDCCGGAGCRQCLIPCPVLSLDNFEFSTGVHGFTGPKNRGSSGSFGFHTGFNWGAPIPCSAGSAGMQFGLNGNFSNFSGASFTDDSRRQLFATGGLFRRVDWGLQGGLVIDYLSDNWYTNTSLTQVRGEASWMFPCTHELGFWFAARAGDDTQVSTLTGNQSLVETWEPTNLYAFFYRHRFAMMEGATARFYAGFSGNKDGLIGGDLRLPLSHDWALETGFAYLIPDEATTGMPGGGHEVESWNIGVSLVWYPGCRTATGNDYYRPLMNVADNGSFMVNGL